MNYPKGIKTEKNINSSNTKYDNRGMGLENDINITNQYYIEKKKAYIYKKPTPIQVTKIDYRNNSIVIKEGYFKEPSTTDYNGLYDGKYIDFEAKETNSKTSFPLSNIHKHQILHIKNKEVEVEKRLIPYKTEIVKEKIKKCGILDIDRVLMSLTYAALTGNGKIRHQFFMDAKNSMRERNHNLYKSDAQGIYKYFKLYDDDIWLNTYNKYKNYFEF